MLRYCTVLLSPAEDMHPSPLCLMIIHGSRSKLCSFLGYCFSLWNVCVHLLTLTTLPYTKAWILGHSAYLIFITRNYLSSNVIVRTQTDRQADSRQAHTQIYLPCVYLSYICIYVCMYPYTFTTVLCLCWSVQTR